MSLLKENKAVQRMIGPQSEASNSDDEKVVYNKGDVVCDWAWANSAKRPSLCSYSDNGDKNDGSIDVTERQQNEDESVDADSCNSSDEPSEDYDTIDDHVLTDLEEEEDDALILNGDGRFAADEPLSPHYNGNESKVTWESLLTNQSGSPYQNHEVHGDDDSEQGGNPTFMEAAVTPAKEEEESEGRESCADSSYCSNKVRLNTAAIEGEIPTSFIYHNAASFLSSSCIDPNCSNAQISTPTLAREHRLLLRGIMELLKERDTVGVTASVDDPMYIKAGFLKEKQSTDVFWKLKYVELRKGILTFYTPSDPSLKRRKFIPLRASLCVSCRAVDSAPHSVAKYTKRGGARSTNTFIFELSVQGHPRRYWMAASNEERIAWIRAIHGATIGGSISKVKSLGSSSGVKRDHFLRHDTDASYRSDVEKFFQIQTQMHSASSKESFVDAISEVWDSPLTLPILWIKGHQEQQQIITMSNNTALPMIQDDNKSNNNNNDTDNQKYTDHCDDNSIADESAVDTDYLFWKDLKKVSVSINGFVVKGKSGWGPERIVGALTRCILELDKSTIAQQRENKIATTVTNNPQRDSAQMTEVQAIAFARDLLLACNFRRTDSVSLYCVEALCNTSELMTLTSPTPSVKDHAITIHIRGAAKRDDSSYLKNRRGWIYSRASSKKPWRSRFCVLSDGIMNCYEKEHPTPHGLVEQIDLSGATIGVSEVEGSRKNLASLNTSRNSIMVSKSAMDKKYLVCVSTKDRSKERQMCFLDQEDFGYWQESLNNASSSVVVFGGYNEASTSAVPPSSPKMELRQKLLGTLRRSRASQTREQNFGIASPTATDDNHSFFKETQQQNPTKEGFSSFAEHRGTNRDFIHSHRVGNNQSSLEAYVQSSAIFEIRAKYPCGDDEKDIWGMIRIQLMQSFLISGGRNDLQCIDETVQLELLR